MGVGGRLERGVERITHSLRSVLRRRRWQADESELPWFERSDAAGWVAERRAAGDPRSDGYAKWLEEGYVVLDGLFDEATLDRAAAEIAEVWEREERIPGLRVHGAFRDAEGRGYEVPHSRIAAMDAGERAALRARGGWRVHALHDHRPALRSIYESPRLAEEVGAILDRPASAHYSICFEQGSEQAPHQDAAVFRVFPRGFLVGAWLALEDVAVDAGPLVVFPGSQREGLFDGFQNYPEQNLFNCPSEVEHAYYARMREVAKRHPEREFLARKGQVLLWHAMVLHGGRDVIRRDSTRRSVVLHYFAEGTNRSPEIDPYL